MKVSSPHTQYIHPVFVLSDNINLLGTYIGGTRLPPPAPLEELEALLSGDEKRKFLEFMRKMLQWAPEQRSTANELWYDDWLQENK